jgi:glucose-1-phosphate cytidylyltransferase
MKAVILAGGLGTRLSEETAVRPKPMVEIGGKPILWHIMKWYALHGINDFIICVGYRGDVIKDYFANYLLHRSDITFDLCGNTAKIHHRRVEPWRVTVAETGFKSMTGGRIRRIREYLDDETFCLTYGDGLSNVNITESIRFHRQQESMVTLTAVQPPGRFGAIVLHPDQIKVEAFREKPAGDGAWINGGYFVVERKAIDYIDGDATVWEAEPLERIASNGQLAAYRHRGFWQPMDTLRDKKLLEDLWARKAAPWYVPDEMPGVADQSANSITGRIIER